MEINRKCVRKTICAVKWGPVGSDINYFFNKWSTTIFFLTQNKTPPEQQKHSRWWWWSWITNLKLKFCRRKKNEFYFHFVGINKKYRIMIIIIIWIQIVCVCVCCSKKENHNHHHHHRNNNNNNNRQWWIKWNPVNSNSDNNNSNELFAFEKKIELKWIVIWILNSMSVYTLCVCQDWCSRVCVCVCVYLVVWSLSVFSHFICVHLFLFLLCVFMFDDTFSAIYSSLHSLSLEKKLLLFFPFSFL